MIHLVVCGKNVNILLRKLKWTNQGLWFYGIVNRTLALFPLVLFICNDVLRESRFSNDLESFITFLSHHKLNYRFFDSSSVHWHKQSFDDATNCKQCNAQERVLMKFSWNSIVCRSLANILRKYISQILTFHLNIA